jgi:hypothetical protein
MSFPAGKHGKAGRAPECRCTDRGTPRAVLTFRRPDADDPDQDRAGSLRDEDRSPE